MSSISGHTNGGSVVLDEDKPQGVFAALKFFVAVVYEETFAYQTIKLVRTYDWRLSLMKRVFTTGVLLYILFFIFLFHGYVEYESPTVVVNADVNQADGNYIPYENEQTYFLSNPLTPEYCFGANIYKFEPGVLEFGPNYCLNYLGLPEYTLERTDSVAVSTYMLQTEYYTQDCFLWKSQADADESNTGQSPDKCYSGVDLTRPAIGIFTEGVEALELGFRASFITSYGKNVRKAETTVQSGDCLTASFPGSCRSFKFQEGEPIVMNVSSLLFVAGVDLDSLNVDSGGIGPTKDQTWPKYRLTGVRLIVSLKYENYFDWKPFTVKNVLTITIKQGNKGLYTKTQQTRFRKTSTFFDGEVTGSNFTVRDQYGIEMLFTSTSLVGRPTFAMFMISLFSSFVLLALATSMVDITAGMIIQGFRESKYEMDLDLRIKTALRMHFLKERKVVEDESAKRPGDNDKLGQMLYNLCCLDVGEEDTETMGELAERKQREEFEKDKKQVDAGIDYVFIEPEHILTEWDNQMKTLQVTSKKAVKRLQQSFKKTLSNATIRNGEFLYVVGEPNHVTSHAKFQWCFTTNELQSKQKTGGGQLSDEYNPWVPVRHATAAAYFVSAADIGHILMCIIQPIRIDGQLGPRIVKITNLVRTHKELVSEVRKLDEAEAFSVFVLIEHGYAVLPARLEIDAHNVTITEVELREYLTFRSGQSDIGSASGSLSLLRRPSENSVHNDSEPTQYNSQQVSSQKNTEGPFKHMTKEALEQRVIYIQRNNIAPEEASSNKGLLKMVKVLGEFGSPEMVAKARPLAVLAEVTNKDKESDSDSDKEKDGGKDDTHKEEIVNNGKIPEKHVTPMDDILELIPSPNDGLNLLLRHVKQGLQVHLRFEHLTERDMALTIVAKRRSQQLIPEIPPQGGNWVNEVFNEQF
mmetsp:Transcript_42207/g.70445  ORF Transcript_42207/g.70445 Transcript_42207/m.70445 type:complete len:920 (-) Transcript_42207:523-3282(-)